MFGVISIPLLTMFASTGGSYATLTRATDAIARGEDEDRAFARIKGAGRHGLWALHDAVKTHSGTERGRLLEAVGRFGTDEGAWTLISEMKTTDPEAKGGAIRGIGHLHAPALYKYISLAAVAKEPAVRAGAVDALGSIGSSAYPLVSALLEGPSQEGKTVALAFLAANGKGQLVEKGISMALASNDSETLYQGVALIARTGDSMYSGQLKRLAKSADERLALKALDTLVAIRKANSAYVLAELCADPDVKEVVWRRAATDLRAFKDGGFTAVIDALVNARPERRDALREILTKDPSDDELLRTMELLTDRQEARAALAETLLDAAGERAQNAAFQRLESARSNVRQSLVAFLRKRAPGKFTPELVTRARNGKRVRDRVIAIELLGELGETEALIHMADLLKDRDPEIRATAAIAMNTVHDKAIEEALIEATHDRVPRVRLSALRGLTRWAQAEDAQAMTAVHDALQDPSDDVRCTAIGLLSVPHDPQLLWTLRERLPEAPARERAAIATALGGIRAPQAVVILVDLALDKEPEVQKSAMQALESR